MTQTERDAVTRIVNAAMDQWSAVLAGAATAQVRIGIWTATTSGRAQGAPGATESAAIFPDGRVLSEGVLAGELRSSTVITAANPDMRIEVQGSHMRNDLWFDPTPLTSNDMQAGKVDALSVMLHEIGHSLAMSGYGQSPPEIWRSPYDLRVTVEGGQPFFSGPNVQAVMGGRIPLTVGNYTHYGNVVAPPGANPLNGLMNGVSFYEATRYTISDLDLAIMADLGLGTIRNDIFDQTWLANLDGGAGIDTFRADYSARTEGLRIVRDLNNDFFVPSSLPSLAVVRLRNVERLDVRMGSGDDTVAGGRGDDRIDGGAGVDTVSYAGLSGAYGIAVASAGWTVRDNRPGSPDGTDLLIGIERVQFQDRTITLAPSPGPVIAAVTAAFSNVLRFAAPAPSPSGLPELADRVGLGLLTQVEANEQVIQQAASTTSVATMAYQFFTGRIPSQAGIDYLVSPTGSNPGNLNSAFYQGLNLENRYINLAIGLGAVGEGRTAFSAAYGGLSLTDATAKAYTEIFGAAPTAARLTDILTPTRVAYLTALGGDALGTKAAMAGWLLAEAVKADLGSYARANHAFLLAEASGAPFGVNILQTYGSSAFTYNPADTTAPVLALSAPADNAAGVAPGADLVLTFSEAIQAGTGAVEIRNSSDGSLFRSIAITDTSQVGVSGSTLTVNPSVDLAAGASYYLALAPGVVRDAAGNPFAGITGSTVLNFATVAAVDDFPNTSAGGVTLPTLAAGGARTGVIETSGDQDAFAVALTAGRSYIFSVHAMPQNGAALTPALSLFSGAGVQPNTAAELASNTAPDGATDARVVFTATTTGLHYLAVAGGAASAGAYTLSSLDTTSVAPPAPTAAPLIGVGPEQVWL